jgi:hypothetical protein
MKKLLILMVLSLQGCAIVDAYLMTHFDPNEYKLITEIRTESEMYKKDCDDPLKAKTNAINLANKTQLFQNYSEFVPRNKEVIQSSKDLNEIAQGLATKYSQQVSPIFCKLKLQNIEGNASLMQKTIAGRPR